MTLKVALVMTLKEQRAMARQYGFRLAAVPKLHCLECDRPIGSHDWELNTTLARFGQLFVEHYPKCPPRRRRTNRVRARTKRVQKP